MYKICNNVIFTKHFSENILTKLLHTCCSASCWCFPESPARSPQEPLTPSMPGVSPIRISVEVFIRHCWNNRPGLTLLCDEHIGVVRLCLDQSVPSVSAAVLALSSAADTVKCRNDNRIHEMYSLKCFENFEVSSTSAADDKAEAKLLRL